MPNPVQHVAHGARMAEKFRYEGDPSEVELRMSKEAASDVLMAFYSLNATYRQGRPIEQIARVLEDMGIEFGEAA